MGILLYLTVSDNLTSFSPTDLAAASVAEYQMFDLGTLVVCRRLGFFPCVFFCHSFYRI